MLNWSKSTFRPPLPFDDDELHCKGKTADGFFYIIGVDDTLKLISSNRNGAMVVNIRCCKNDPDRRFRLYTCNQNDLEFEMCPPEAGYGNKRWYFVNRQSLEVYVANHCGESIQEALEGVENLL